MTANGLLPTAIDHCIAISHGLQRDEQVAPRVSVIIPVFNRDGLIAACVRSVQAQTLTDLEIIVIDDASTDRTAQVVAALAARDPRIRLVRCERNIGPGMARNLGIASSNGAWVALLDSDDEYHPDRLRCLLETAETTQADMIADNLWLCNGDPGSDPELMLRPSELPETTVINAVDFVRLNTRSGSARSARRTEYGFLKPLIRRDFLTTYGIRYDDIRFSEDYLLYLRCLIAGARWIIIPLPLYQYTITDNSLTHQCTKEDLRRLATAESRLLDNSGVKRDEQLADAIGRHRQSVVLALAWTAFAEALKRKDPVGAVNSLFSAPGAIAHVTRESLRAITRVIARVAKTA
jgi:glycosyl transferase family 2